jgi:16S rRNA (guanine527-N7)-methyltransferase
MGVARHQSSAHELLTETLRQAQRFGFFGPSPIELAIEHAGEFVTAIGAAPPATRIIDIGSGGGLPGLVVAARLRDADVTLLDRREKRTDFLRQAASRLGFGHVRVVAADATLHARAVESGEVAAYDVVTARGFGPAEQTLRIGRRLIGDHGMIVISEPPAGHRWDQRLLSELGLDSERIGKVRRFQVSDTACGV